MTAFPTIRIPVALTFGQFSVFNWSVFPWIACMETERSLRYIPYHVQFSQFDNHQGAHKD